MSARPRHNTMLCHSVTSLRSPVVLSLYVSDVAMVKLATEAPFSRFLISGSLPKRPTRITLFTPDICLLFIFSFSHTSGQRSADLLSTTDKSKKILSPLVSRFLKVTCDCD